MTVPPPARPVDLVVAAPASVKPAPPRRRSLALTAAVCLAVGAVAGLVAGRQSAPAAAEAPAAESATPGPAGDVVFGPDLQSAAGVVTAAVKSEPLVARVWRAGRVAAQDDRVAHVVPPAEGIVRDAPVRLGQAVNAGDVLAVIDSRELGLAKLEAFKARVALAAERELTARTRTTTANARELLDLLAADTPLAEIEKRTADKPIGDWRQQLLGASARRRQLRSQLASQQAASGAIPEATVRRTEAEAEAAAAAYTALVEDLRFQATNQVRQAELKLKDAETAVDVARTKLLLLGLTPDAADRVDPVAEGAAASRLVLKAPFAGTVVEKHAVRSERVGPQTEMFVVADLSAVWVRADVFEADLPLVRGLAGRPVAFRSLSAGVPERAATVLYAGDLIDKATRTTTLTAEAANPDRLLKPGLFVEVGFEVGDRTPVLQVPAAAVLRHENAPFVFVQTAADRFRRADVRLGRSAGDNVEVTAGLNPGDRVVVRGGFVLKSELLKDQMAGE